MSETPKTDAFGTPIDPPSVKEPESRIVLFLDTETNEFIWSSMYVPMPQLEGRQFTLDVYADGNRVHHLYYIDRIDAASRTVFLTLNKVYVNDNPQFPLS